MSLPRSRITKQTGLASLACTACRKQHLKCDGKRPICLRCLQNGHSCDYQPSRRGGRRKPRVPQPQHGPTASTEDSANSIALSPSLTPRSHDGPNVSFVPGSATSFSSISASGDNRHLRSTGPETEPLERPRFTSTRRRRPGDTPAAPGASILESSAPAEDNLTFTNSEVSFGDSTWPVSGQGNVQNDSVQNDSQPQGDSTSDIWWDSDRFLRLFYENFHTGHPVLVPGHMYLSQKYPPFLRLIVDFAGSHYVQHSPCDQLKRNVLAELASNPDRSAYMVQARLIFSIALFSRGEVVEAREEFARCTEIAIELGMNRAEFASRQSPETSVEAESLRRTWWEIFITDILMAVPLKVISFRCSILSPEVPLPCEEAVYRAGRNIPHPHKILEFKRRILCAEDVSFSSFSYRIEAATILGRVLILNRLKNYHRDHLQAIENALVSWSNHLPLEKLDIVDSYGNMDEMMFQSHAIIAYASMLLHLPRSRFYPLLSNAQDDFMPFTQLHSISASTRLVQSIKATNASQQLTDYISLCPNIQRHTPLIIPALVTSGLIQIATSNNHAEECFDHHYNRITLVLGCLKTMRQTWRLAEPAYQRVRSFAAALICDKVDKWNAEPLSKSIALAQSTSNTSSQTSPLVPEQITEVPTQNSAIPGLDPSFIDSICSNYSLFNSILNFEDI